MGYITIKKSFIIVILAFCFLFAGSVFASTGDNVTGSAWSSNIGYISFNCTSQPSGCDAPPEGAIGGGVGGAGGTGEGDAGTGGAFNNFSQSPFAFFKNISNKIDFIFKNGIFTHQKAYADGIGGLAMGSNYGVNVDPVTGVMSGYAWSPYVGWISFSEVGGCPAESCTPVINFETGKLSGFAKVLSATGASGWDGWISLSCSNVGLCGGLGFGSNYQVTLNTATSNLEGFAWGDDVVGWIKFTGPLYSVHVDLTQPTLNISVSDGEYCPGDTPMLSWVSTNMVSCTGNASNGDTAFSGSVALASPTGGIAVNPSIPSTTYTISCTGVDGETYTDTVDIVGGATCTSDLILSATPNPVTVATGYTTTVTWYSPSSTNFSSCVGYAYNAEAGVPDGTLAVPPTGFEGVHTPLNLANGYTLSDTGVSVPNNPTKFRIDCIKEGTTEHMIADTLVGRAVLYPSCDFKDAGTFLSGTPFKATLTWESFDALNAVASSLPPVGTTWTGAQLLNGSKTNVGFISPSTTYILDVTAGAEANQCKAVLNIPVECTPETEEIYTCDGVTTETGCYIDPNGDDPNGCDPDVQGSLTLTATPNTFTLDPGETASTSVHWDGTYVEGDGLTWSDPTTSFGPVDCAVDGSDSVSISESTTFTLTCTDMYSGDEITATTGVTVNGIPPCDFIPDNDIEDCPVPIDGFTRPVFIER